jgi:hypothetical protein
MRRKPAMSRHNCKKNETARGQNKIYIVEGKPSRRSQKTQKHGSREPFTGDSFSLIHSDNDPDSLHARSALHNEVFELLHRTSRRKDEIISSLIGQNSELLHHLRFLEDLVNRGVPPPADRCMPSESRLLPLAVLRPLPAPEKSENDARENLQKQLENLKKEHETEAGTLKAELQERSKELERMKETIKQTGGNLSCTGPPLEQAPEFQEIREKLKKEAEAKMRVIQEFMELSESFGEKEEGFKRELGKKRQEIEEKEIKVALTERHLDDVKAAKLLLKEECEKLRRELEKEKNRPWWQKAMTKIFPPGKESARGGRTSAH